MGYLAVIRDAAPGWIEAKDAFEQPGVDDHGAFMNQLAVNGFVLFAGPLAGSEVGLVLVLLIADAQSGRDVYDILAADPWAGSETLVTSNVETWTPIVGSDRLAPVS